MLETTGIVVFLHQILNRFQFKEFLIGYMLTFQHLVERILVYS